MDKKQQKTIFKNKWSRKTIQRLATLGEAITIPQSLIDQLAPYGKRYIKVAKPIPGDKSSGKRALEKGFQNKPYAANDSSLQDWLKHGGNYGVLAGEGVILVDADCKTVRDIIDAKITTFTVQSGRINGEGRHYYFRSDASENGEIFDDKGDNIGHIQVQNKYVVGPNSRHFSGGTYQIINDTPIAWISKQTLNDIFAGRLKWFGAIRQEHIDEAKEESAKLKTDIPLAQLIDLSQLKQRGDEYQGGHPVHGSETGMNFCVNPNQNVWHCFRCNSGGGGLMWLAVKHGLIQCHEAKKRALRGSVFMDAVRLAKEQGFQIVLPDEAMNPEIERFFDKDVSGNLRFVPAYVGNEMMKDTPFFSESNKSVLYRYDKDKGIYKPDGASFINKQLTGKLGKHYSITRRNEVEAFIHGSSIKELPEANKYLIAVQNGVYNIVIGELKPFSPDFCLFNALPVKYDESAQCPVFLKFLSEVVPSEADRLLLQEHGGYLLLKDCRFQKALMLIGNAQNGKSTFLKVLIAMLGEENVTTLPLQLISDSKMRFYTSQLYSKLANICTDLPSNSLTETDAFKKIVSGDPITGEFKFSAPFDFEPYVKLLYAANQLPTLPKDTEAFLLRWNMVSFPVQFLPGDPRRDENLIYKLTTPEELSGVLNWCLDGLHRLVTQKHFSAGETLEQAKDRWIVEGDSVKAFKERCVEEEFTEKVTKDDAYSAYAEFCTRHKVKPQSKNTFGSLFSEYAQSGRTHVDGKQVRVWQGIALKQEETDD